jgi:lipoprotein-anchoring transpeptidase ErfK/SrfK
MKKAIGLIIPILASSIFSSNLDSSLSETSIRPFSGLEQKIEFPVTISISEKDTKQLRGKLREELKNKYNISALGSYLDNLESEFKDKIKEVNLNNPNSLDKTYSLEAILPNNFLVGEMELNLEINKKERMLYVYQNFNSEKKLLLKTGTALGKPGFSTPAGTFFIKRIVLDPWWYPPQTWAKGKSAEKPGKNNAYGLYMAELCKNDMPAKYEFSPSGDAGIRIHSTNHPLSIGSYSSHGCVRVHPDAAEELFPFLLRYSPHLDGIKNGRGIVHPLEKPIKVEIK